MSLATRAGRRRRRGAAVVRMMRILTPPLPLAKAQKQGRGMDPRGSVTSLDTERRKTRGVRTQLCQQLLEQTKPRKCLASQSWRPPASLLPSSPLASSFLNRQEALRLQPRCVCDGLVQVFTHPYRSSTTPVTTPTCPPPRSVQGLASWSDCRAVLGRRVQHTTYGPRSLAHHDHARASLSCRGPAQP